jgi:Zn-dependent protease/CBS domain-containing protein
MLVAYFALSFFAEGGLAFALQGTILIISLFACVVLHELGHALTAKRFGIRTRDITLLPIGGVARLERIPSEPLQELLIAVAGPLVNVAIALAIFIALRVAGHAPLDELQALMQTTEKAAFLGKVGWLPYLLELLSLNIFMVVFNLIPAFPMDGGRILRSLLAFGTSYLRATQAAARIGQAIAVMLALWGFLQPNPLLVFIAVFVFLGAAGEASATQMRHGFEGLPTQTGMVTDFRTLTRDDTLAHAADILIHGNQIDFPVLDGDKVAGMLTRQTLVTALRERGPGTPLGEVPLSRVEPVDAEMPLTLAYDEMGRQETQCLPVLRAGRLVGLITAENIAELAMVRSALDASQER